MSNKYRIKIKETVSESISDSDYLRSKIRLCEAQIIPDEEMKNVFQEKLEKRGFKETKKGNLSKTEDNGEITVDLNNMELKTELSGERRVKVSGEKREVAAKDNLTKKEKQEFGKKKRAALKKELQKLAKDKAQAVKGEIVRDIASKLTDIHEKARQEIGAAIWEAQAEALKKKAARLGSIIEVQEDNGPGHNEIRIKIVE